MFEFQNIKRERAAALKEQLKKVNDREWKTEEAYRKAKNKVAQKELTEAIRQILILSFEKDRGAYVKTKTLLDLFSGAPEKRIRCSLTKLKGHFAEEGIILSNHPGKGYRIGINDDIPIETCKSMFRSLANLVNGYKIIASTVQGQESLDALGKELLDICRQYGQMSLAPLKALSDKVKDHPLYGDLYEQLKSLDDSKAGSLGDMDDL